MGVVFSNREKEVVEECIINNGTNFPVPGQIIDKLSETIVKIENGDLISTGFFMKINVQEINRNFLLTCGHSIPQEDINSKKTITIFYGKKEAETKKEIELDNNKRFIKCFLDDDIDATILEILPEDNISEDKYLYPDLNYTSGFDNYIKENKIFTAGYPDIHPYKGEKHYSGGEITGIRYMNNNNSHFFHNCSTKEGSSGSPLVNDKFQVVGIHYGCNKKKIINFGVFVGAIIDILNGGREENKSNFKEKIQKDVNIEIKKVVPNKKMNNNETKKINDDEIKEVFIKDNNVNKQKIDNKEVISQKQITNSDMKLIGQPFENLPLMNIYNILLQDPKMHKHINNMKDIQELKEKNPILNEAFNYPDFLEKITKPDVADTIKYMFSIINNKKNIKEEEKNNIDDPKIFEKKVNQLKNML